MTERQHGYDKATRTRPTMHEDDRAVGRHSSSLTAPEHPIESGIVMRKARDANGVAADADASVGAASSSSGSPLPAPLMRKFEASLGADLSAVRVHTGHASATAASAVGARAYTMGQDIHFGAGQYDPSSAGGQHLVAHEVAHTVQQRGTAPTRQNKLSVSSPHDAAEHEADRAADAMLAGVPAAVSALPVSAARKPAVDPSTGDLQGAGDEAQTKAWATPLQVDTLSVQTDRSRVGEVVKDIDAQKGAIESAVKADADIETKYAPIATNTATRVNLSVFNDKLDVSGVDTAAFSSQYRYAYADYQRLMAEAKEYTTLTNRTRGNDPLATVGIEHENASGLAIQDSPQSQRFRNARQNLNSAAKHMDAQITKSRGAANGLQAAVYKAKAAAAQAQGAEAAKKLAAVNQEIADVAGGVSTVVKIFSAIGGLAGGSGATDALGTAKASNEAGGGAEIAPSQFGQQLGFKGTQVDLPEEHSRKVLMQAMGADAASVFSGGGGPEQMAEKLVTAIGKYANKDKIGRLQVAITKAAAEEASFKAAGESLSMVADQQKLEGEAKELMVLQQAFASAKVEIHAAGEELMKLLNKGGAKGKKQARAVLFLADADRFLAQVETALSAGRNQQQNLKLAAVDRRSLRGTSKALGEKGVPGDDGNEVEASNQYYYRCTKIVSPGLIYGTNTTYKLDKVFVKFQDNGTIHQGGKGTIEGAGSADDEVANKIKTLETAKLQVRDLQVKLQGSLNLGEPLLNG